MLLSLALIFLMAMSLNAILTKLKIPGLLGMIFTGIVLGPYALDIIAPEILSISADLREVALIVILLRAGLSLDIQDLKRVGRPAILMCFLPATLEIAAIVTLAPIFLSISILEAAILGTVVAAVSPAVVVPRMIRLIDEGYGKKHSIPQLVMAGASVDDIFVIVLFASFMGMYKGASFDAVALLKVPVSIVVGIAVGILVGMILVWFFRKRHMRDTVKVVVILCIAFLLTALEDLIAPYVPMSGLLSIMALGATILGTYEPLSLRLKQKFSKIWIGAEIILFVLVGAAVDLSYLKFAGILSVVLILIGLVFRVIGVNLSLIKTKLSVKERAFCSVAYLPKATVQAAIGAIPLTAGVAAGHTILVIAVLAIVLTAPIGALGIDRSYKRLLDHPVE